jgi:hypothetical protein
VHEILARDRCRTRGQLGGDLLGHIEPRLPKCRIGQTLDPLTAEDAQKQRPVDAFREGAGDGMVPRR